MKRHNSQQSTHVGSRRVEHTRPGRWPVATDAASISNKRRKMHEGRSPESGKQRDEKPRDAGGDADFPKLDQSNPEHARRIQQRRRMVAFGKNTVGYDEYLKKVPKTDRRLRCMTHPSTPDHTLDIPTKRWQGLVKAWRRALHQYDPPDMMKALNEEAPPTNVDDGNVAVETTIKERQISEAAAKGLPVVIHEKYEKSASSSSPSSEATFISSDAGDSDVVRQIEMEDLDMWEQGRGDDGHLLDEDDSDDDLL